MKLQVTFDSNLTPLQRQRIRRQIDREVRLSIDTVAAVEVGRIRNGFELWPIYDPEDLYASDFPAGLLHERAVVIAGYCQLAAGRFFEYTRREVD